MQIHTDEEQVGGTVMSIENRLKKQQQIVFGAQGPPQGSALQADDDWGDSSHDLNNRSSTVKHMDD